MKLRVIIIRYFVWLVLIISVSACGRYYSKRINYIPQAVIKEPIMRLDGYYYTSNLTDRPSPTVTRYFFFSNGKVLFGFNCELDSLQEKESDFDNNFFERQLSPGYNANITNFAIDGSTIQFERVYPMQDYPHAIFSGNIQNDSTFVIRSCKDLRAGTAEKENSIYHFRPFSIPEKYRLIMLARK